jgi:hypothetical protein
MARPGVHEFDAKDERTNLVKSSGPAGSTVAPPAYLARIASASAWRAT